MHCYLSIGKVENFDHHQIATISNFIFSCSAHILQLLINANKEAFEEKMQI